MAERITGTLSKSSATAKPLLGLLQRKCACGTHTNGTGECSECVKKQPSIQRLSHDRAVTNKAPAVVHEVLRSPGQPLDHATRAFFEPRFGHDFGQVRVHTDARAAESADAVQALAYTVGRDVVFGAARYAPGANEGNRLLAHELTHVIQQNGMPLGTELTVGPQNDAYEQEADRAAANVMHTELAASRSPRTSAPAVRRTVGVATVQRSEKGAALGALGGAAAGAIIGGIVGGGLGALAGGLLGAGLGALIGALVHGSKVSVDKSCDKFCPSLDVADEAKKTDSKATAGCKDVKFNYQVAGKPAPQRFDQKIDLNHVTVKCDASNADCGGWSSRGVITLGKAACNAATCGPLASSILHEMIHDWAGWGPPYDKKNVTVPGATHTTPDYLDEWVARYVEKSCFGYNPWGLP